jgi:radical SAM superfamily enzyme YgiQ (UPF0313 family)
MKIALVICPSWTNFCPPLGIAYLSAILKNEGHTVRCFDINIGLENELKGGAIDYWAFSQHHKWHFPYFQNEMLPLIKQHLDDKVDEILAYDPDVIGFTVYNTSSLASLHVAKELKKRSPDKKIVFGGPECYKEINTTQFLGSGFVDAVVVGEGEETLKELLKVYAHTGRLSNIKGALTKTNTGFPEEQFEFRELIEHLESLPFPDFSDFNLKKYTRNALPIMTSRGCVARCAFCGEARYWKKFRFRKAENIFLELKRGVEDFGIRNFLFSDSLINGNLYELAKLADLIIDNKLYISWGGYARVNKHMDLDLFVKLKKAGCVYLCYGIESGSQKVVNDMRKMFLLKDAQINLANTIKAGIEAYVNWMVGFPTETWIDFLKSLNFIYRNRKHITFLNPGQSPCGIPPDSDLEKDASRFNITKKPFLNNWRTRYFTNTVIHRNLRLRILRKFISTLKMNHSYLKEFPDDKMRLIESS